MPTTEKIVAKGNRLTELKDQHCVEVVGYRLYTGEEGQETADASYCGTRAVEYLIANHAGLRGVPQFAYECPEHPDWDCWLLVESSDTESAAACDTPSASAN